MSWAINDSRRLQACWTLSLCVHGAALATFLTWQKRVEMRLPVLDNVELIEPEALKPPSSPTAVPQKEEKTWLDLIKTALPKKTAALLEESVRPEKKPSLMETQAPAPIDLKKGLAGVKPEINLDRANVQTKGLSDAAMPEAARSQRAPALSEAPIKLEEVGRVAVAKPQAPVESIALRTTTRRLAGDGAIALPGLNRPSKSALKEETIALNRGPAVRVQAPVADDRALALQNAPAGAAKGPGAGSIRDLTAPAKAISKSSDERLLGEKSFGREKAMELKGPISNRKILKYFLPEYPQWARDQAIAASVSIKFWVASDGRVSNNTVIERTSGYKDLDERAIRAIKGWLFEPLNSSEEQWGVVTFRYVLE